ncbi:ribokinase [candidate division KSB1 bacterium]
MEKPKIVVVGSSNTDMVIKMERLPGPGETVIGGDFILAAGGKGANQAVAAARLGGDVTLVARIGTDIFGKQAVQNFQKEGINTDYVIKDEANPSGAALIFVDRKGENSIAVASGSNCKLSKEDVEAAREIIVTAHVMILQLEIPVETVKYAARLASDAGVKVILNPAPAGQLDEELLRLITVITPNESEIEFLTGIKVTEKTSAGQAAQVLKKKGVSNIIITMGAQGSFLLAEDQALLVPARKVEAVDTTAAGDAFNGALAYALGKRKPLVEAVQFANLTGSFSATKLGAQPSLPTLEEIIQFGKN